MKIRKGCASVVLGAFGVAGCASILGIGDVPNPSDGGGLGDAATETPADTSSATCPRTTPIDATLYQWRSPSVTAVGSCSNVEMAALVDYVVTHQDEKPTQWRTNVGSSVGAGCLDCVFGVDDQAPWHPIMVDGSGDVARYYVGGCIAIETDQQCGKAYQGLFDCHYEACANCGGDSLELKACFTASDTGACKTAFDSLDATCGGKPRLDAARATCELAGGAVWEGSARRQCVGPGDGG